jgi:hypothetical protein
MTAFIWDAQHGVRDLKQVLIQEYGLTAVEDWALIDLYGISADGLTLVGEGSHPDPSGGGAVEAFLVRLPEPTGILSWLLPAAFMRRRR